MYLQIYEEMTQDSAQQARAIERDALEKAIAKLVDARAKGSLTPEAFEATRFMRQLWSVFLNDLRGEGNGLPPDLKNSLISIGLWLTREADLIDRGQSTNFDALIDINRTIAEGLGQ